MQSELSIIQSQFAERLCVFLSLIWEKRHEPTLDLYKLYVGGRPHDSSDDYEGVGGRPEVVAFLEKLEHAMNRTSIEVQIQAWGELSNYEIDFSDVVDIAKNHEGWADVGKSFFHFPKGGSANWRIYLNVPPLHRGDVACFMVESIVSKIEGVTNAKVLGPTGIGWDTIVIYLTNESVMKEVLGLLAEYQEKNRSYFADQIIHIARQAEWLGKNMPGVAIACEPYRHTEALIGKAKKLSFGNFWETLVRPILDKTRHQSEQAFFKAVLEKMILIGIDPKNPER